jgi:hypothetical protein
MKFKDRYSVFRAGRNISNRIGDIASNEFDFNHIDVLEEFTTVDKMVNELQEYKRLLLSEIIN